MNFSGPAGTPSGHQQGAHTGRRPGEELEVLHGKTRAGELGWARKPNRLPNARLCSAGRFRIKTTTKLNSIVVPQFNSLGKLKFFELSV